MNRSLQTSKSRRLSGRLVRSLVASCDLPVNTNLLLFVTLTLRFRGGSVGRASTFRW
jgi:hypothetical protein